MKKIIVTKDGIQEIDLTPEEIAEIEEQQELQDFEQSLQPSTEEVEQMKFELKTITLLLELGVI